MNASGEPAWHSDTSARNDGLDRATEQVCTGQWAAGEQTLNAVIQTDPKNVIAHELLGGCLSMQNKEEPALAAYRTAVTLDPAYKIAWHNLGFCLEHFGRLDEAESAYWHAVSLPPPTCLSLHNLGNCLLNQGKWEYAIKAYRDALECEPHNEDVRWNLQYALAHERAAETYGPRNTSAERLAASHFLAGLESHTKGEQQIAIREYKAALSADPAHGLGRGNLVRLLLSEGCAAEAALEATRYISNYPDSAEPYLLLASCYEVLGLTDESMRQLEMAFVLDQNSIKDPKVALLVGMSRILRSHALDPEAGDPSM